MLNIATLRSFYILQKHQLLHLHHLQYQDQQMQEVGTKFEYHKKFNYALIAIVFLKHL